MKLGKPKQYSYFDKMRKTQLKMNKQKGKVNFNNELNLLIMNIWNESMKREILFRPITNHTWR